MLFPIHDDNPRTCLPLVSWIALAGLLVATCFALGERGPTWLWVFGLGRGDTLELMPLLWVVYLVYGLAQFGFHWVFADNVEDRLGAGPFAMLYLLSGLLGAALETVVHSAIVPGAFLHAALAFVTTAYVILFPRRGVTFYAFLGHSPRSRTEWFQQYEFRLPAWGAVLIGLLFHVIAMLPVAVPPAPFALLAGCFVGTAAGWLLRKRGQGDLWHDLDEEDYAELSSRVRVPSTPHPPKEGPAAPPPPLSARVSSDDSSFGAFLEVDGAPPPPPPSRSSPASTEQGWAVFRTDGDLVDILRLSGPIVKATGEMRYEVSRRLRASRGLLATDLDHDAAKQLVATCSALGVAATCAPWTREQLQRERTVAQVAWSESSIAFVLRDGSVHDYPWRSILLIAGVQVEAAGMAWPMSVDGDTGPGELLQRRRSRAVESLEFFVRGRDGTPPLRLRVRRDFTRFAGATGPGIRELASFCTSRNEIRLVGRGVTVLARRGSWGHLRFKTESELASYLSWLLLRASARRSALEFLE